MAKGNSLIHTRITTLYIIGDVSLEEQFSDYARRLYKGGPTGRTKILWSMGYG